jgi:hypothetical protein
MWRAPDARAGLVRLPCLRLLAGRDARTAYKLALADEQVLRVMQITITLRVMSLTSVMRQCRLAEGIEMLPRVAQRLPARRSRHAGQ